MSNVIICDLDGTLAECEHRVHHVQKVDGNGLKKRPDWGAFFAGVRDDTVNGAVLSVLDRFMAYGNPRLEIIFCSGRPEQCREDTQWWLGNVAHLFWDDYTLFMRPDGDFRADNIVKQEIYDTHIKGKYDVLFVMDDRQQVVDMWRRNGLTCFQVAEGNF